MIPRRLLPLPIVFSLVVFGLAVTPSSYLSTEDRDRLKEILKANLKEVMFSFVNKI